MKTECVKNAALFTICLERAYKNHVECFVTKINEIWQLSFNEAGVTEVEIGHVSI